MRHTLPFVLSLSLSLTSVACGGGGGDSTPSTTAPESSTESGVSFGTITGFGSVFVNGVRYNTDNAEVTRDDNPLNDVRELEIGMLVRVEGDLDSAIASRVSFDETVKGPVDSVSPLTVLGQSVITNAATRFNDTSQAQLAVGDVLEISGLRDANDDIVASFIEKKDTANVDKYKVTGNVRNLDTAAMSFQIDGLTIDYSAADVNDLPGGVPTDGQLLEVKDENTAYTAGTLNLTATKIETQNVFGAVDISGRKVEIESIVTQVNSSTEFVVGGITVNTMLSTRFLFGTPDNITAGAKIEVEGSIDSNGVLQALKVKFEDNDARIQARVDAIDTTARTLTLLGISVTVTNNTSFEDNVDNSDAFSLETVQIGDYLEIRGFMGANNAFIASELERENDDNKVEIRAKADAKDVTAGTVTLLGMTINSDAGTQYQGLGDESVSRTQFFSAITPGLTIVQAKWDPFTDLGAPVKEFELED